MRSALSALLALAPAILVGAGPAAAQDYPTKPIKLIVGFAPGGGTDTTGRIFAKKLSENLNQQVVVENRAGAGGVIAHEIVAKAAPDGYTLLLGTVGAFTVSPYMQQVGYDTERDFAPITMGVVFPNVLVVNAKVKANTLADYLALARSEPMPYGSSGVGAAGHLAGELLRKMSGADLVHVPYRGGGPAMIDLLSGQLPSQFGATPGVMQYLHTGQIRVIATTASKRARDLPDIPTIGETFPGYEATNWYAFAAPAKTPRAIIDKLNTEIGYVMRAPDVLEQLGRHGLEPSHTTPEELAAYMRREAETWSKLVKELGIKPE